MSYEEFINLKEGDTVEDKDGILGQVTNVDLPQEEAWVLWEDAREPLWSNYWDIKVY